MSDETPPPPHPNCVKCGTKMLQGLEVRGDGTVGRWVQGEVRRVWLFCRIPTGRRYEIITFRCPNCGYLESYSPVV